MLETRSTRTIVSTHRQSHRRAVSLLGGSLATLILVSGCASAPGAETAEISAPLESTPFSAQQLEASYDSDRTIDYVPMLAGFEVLEQQFPDVLEQNMQLTVEINHGADEEQRDRARIDQYEDMSLTMADGLGESLGQIYLEAAEAGELPKTMALIAKDEQRAAGEGASSNPSKEYFAYPRPYNADSSAIERIDREGGDAYDSTSGAYPSGHTSQAYWQGTILATLVPELAGGVLARVSEAGDNRIVMGVHYPIDVMGGRMMGQAIAAKRWADEEFQELLTAASEELHTVLEAGCGAALDECIAADKPYLPADEAAAIYADRMSYGFGKIGTAGEAFEAPESAAALLISSHPELSEEQREQVLALTALDSGYPLDAGGADGDWQRIDLLAAMTAEVVVGADGTVALAK